MESEIINDNNADSIIRLKRNKRGNEPYFATVSAAMSVMTDYDSFPYGRWFRGQYKSSEPIVAEREAGWRMRDDACYKPEHEEIHRYYPKHCFEPPCSTVYPCMLSYNDRFSGSEKRNTVLNDECIVQYR